MQMFVFRVSAILSARADLIDEQTLKRLDPELGFRVLRSVNSDCDRIVVPELDGAGSETARRKDTYRVC